MANTISVNVYEVDGRAQTAAKRLFSTGSIYARPYDGLDTTHCNAIIHDNVTKKTYAVNETVAALATLAG